MENIYTLYKSALINIINFPANVFVEWDSGYINYYFYGKFNGNKSIRKIQEYRRVADGMVAVGCRVMRGMNSIKQVGLF